MGSHTWHRCLTSQLTGVPHVHCEASQGHLQHVIDAGLCAAMCIRINYFPFWTSLGFQLRWQCHGPNKWYQSKVTGLSPLGVAGGIVGPFLARYLP